MKIKFDHTPKEPMLREVREQIQVEINVLACSFREADGVIRNPCAVNGIVRLRKALKLLPSRLPEERKALRLKKQLPKKQ